MGQLGLTLKKHATCYAIGLVLRTRELCDYPVAVALVVVALNHQIPLGSEDYLGLWDWLGVFPRLATQE